MRDVFVVGELKYDVDGTSKVRFDIGSEGKFDAT